MRSVWAGVAVLALASCSGNPLNNQFDTGSTTTPTTPTASDNVSNYEAANADGSGSATNIAYDATNDTVSVQNLAFTGNRVFTKDAVLSAVSPYSVYDSPLTAADIASGNTIYQFPYAAVYAKSASGQSDFAVVRTGDYIGYGFGGYVYERNGSVTLPTTGQAHYAGNYAGLIDFTGVPDSTIAPQKLALGTGAVDMTVQFDAFNTTATGPAQAAIRGYLYNRKIYDMNGNDITTAWTTALSTQYSTSVTSLPVAVFTVGPGVMAANGTASAGVTSTLPNGTQYENGTYYIVFAGTNATEAAGIVVLTSSVPGASSGSSVTARQTSGFLLVQN